MRRARYLTVEREKKKKGGGGKGGEGGGGGGEKAVVRFALIKSVSKIRRRV